MTGIERMERERKQMLLDRLEREHGEALLMITLLREELYPANPQFNCAQGVVSGVLGGLLPGLIGRGGIA